MATTLEEVRDKIENARESSARYQSATGQGFDMLLEGIEDAIYVLAQAVDELRASAGPSG